MANQPINKTLLYWIFQVIGWSSFGVYQLLVFYFEGRLNWFLTFDTIGTIIGMILLSHLYRNYIKRHNWMKLVFVRLFGKIFMASMVLSLLAFPLQVIISAIVHPEDSDLLISIVSSQSVVSTVLVNVISLMFLFVGWSIFYFFYHYISSYNRALRWEAMVNEFELNRLKSQLNPHFIFNALNVVKALVDEEPEKAKDSIFKLSNILRSSLMMDKKKVIPFLEELSIVESYLSLEKVRFEERLGIEIEATKECEKYKVPPMMLQTLVENGIKHGISRLIEGGVIRFKAFEEDGYLKIEIRNNGEYIPGSNPTGTGYGLKSTKQRLQLLFGDKAEFFIRNEDTTTVLTEVTIPMWDNTQLETVHSVF